MKTQQQEKTALLLLADALAMTGSFWLALVFGYKAPAHWGLFGVYQWGFITLLFSVIVMFIILDIYSFHRMPVRILRQAVLVGEGLLASAVITTFIFFFFRDTVPRAVFLLFYAFSFVLIVFFRYGISARALSSVQWRILLVGDGQRSAEIARLVPSREYLRSEVVGYVSSGPVVSSPDAPRFLGGGKDLLAIVERERISQVIVAAASIDDELTNLLLECMKRKIKVQDFREVIEDITGKVPIEYLTDNWFILQISPSDKRYFWLAKRFLDIVFASVGLFLAAPLFPVIAALIRLDSRGPVFYSQQRVGRGNKLFRVWKLRTMVVDADKNNVYWTLDKDSRITRIGRLIRKARFDEVPQLVNVLCGEMSLIGPRPEAMSLVERYRKEIPYYLERHMVTPGITGWAQISHRYGNSIEDTRQKLMYDFYYIKNRSFALDTMIFLRTIKIVLTGQGAL